VKLHPRCFESWYIYACLSGSFVGKHSIAVTKEPLPLLFIAAAKLRRFDVFYLVLRASKLHTQSLDSAANNSICSCGSFIRGILFLYPAASAEASILTLQPIIRERSFRSRRPAIVLYGAGVEASPARSFDSAAKSSNFFSIYGCCW
jgi:hypothetical protein